jgi:hypothetical protein
MPPHNRDTARDCSAVRPLQTLIRLQLCGTNQGAEIVAKGDVDPANR